MMISWCITFYSTQQNIEKLKVRTKRLKSLRIVAVCILVGVILRQVIMADLLSTNANPLSSNLLALMVDQKSQSEISTNRRNNAFKKLVADVQETKENYEHCQERAKHLELDVTRMYAQLARTRDALTKEQSITAELRGKMAKSQICAKCFRDTNEEGATTERYSSGESGEASRELKKAQRRIKQSEVSSQKEEVLSSINQDDGQLKEGKKRGGVSHEEHELMIRQAMMLKEQLTTLAKEKGMNAEKIMEAAEYKQIIRKLQQDNQERVDQNEVLLERIRELCSNESGEGSQVTELQFQNDKLQKKLNIGQVMIDMLSKRCEELEAELKSAQKQTKDAVDGSTAFGGNRKVVKSVDQIDSQFLSDERKKHRQQVERLEEELQLNTIQLDQLMAENKQLFKDRQATEKQREIFEDRYNKLMETLQAVQQRQRQCSNCRALEQELTKLRIEFADLKEVNELVSAQMKLYEEDLRQEQLDMENLKLKNTFHIEQWKRNCQKMGQQVDLLMGDLQKERELRQRLQQQVNQVKTRPPVSMAASFPHTPSPRCGAMSSPYAGVPLSPDVEVDGPGGDYIDGTTSVPSYSPKSASSGYSEGTGASLRSNSSKSTSSGRSEGKASPSSPESLSQDKVLECPRCKREYPADKMMELQEHVNKCFDSS